MHDDTITPDDAERSPQRLDRLFRPTSIAFVGVTEASRWAHVATRSLGRDVECFFVHHEADEAFGRRTHRALADIGRPVDAVFSSLGAKRTVELVEMAAATGAGGVVTCAGGFAEMGADGAHLQHRLVDGARSANMPVVGPNGVGLINVPDDLHLSMLPLLHCRAGGLSAATHSGAMIEAMAAAGARAGGVGFNLLVSAGNEAVTDVADYLDFFADDDRTRVIALAVESIRRPEAFFGAARRCLEAGKPIVALKLGRSERTQRMAASHTGTLTGDAWVYDVAFAQAGILPATDIDDLVDRVQFLEQLPPRKWTPVRGLAILTGTGGFAQLASDLAEEAGIDVPEVERLRPFVEEAIPGGTVTNPLDVTGFVGVIDGLWRRVLVEYEAAPEFDTVLWSSQHAEWNEPIFTDIEFAEIGATSEKPYVIGPLAGPPGRWLERYRDDGIAVGNGLTGCLKGLHTMAAFMRLDRDSAVRPPSRCAVLPRPIMEPIAVAEGAMLPFAATMELLADAGIPVAPYHLIPSDCLATAPQFAGPYVVKLADVPHRTELGAVRLSVGAEDVHCAVADLRALADRHGLPSVVAVQPMLAGHGEAFIGVRGHSELGPVVAFGLGGVFVEVLGRVGGRMAPMSVADAAALLDEFSDTGVLDGFRGAPAWDRNLLARVLCSASELAAGGRGWIESIDINPVIITADGVAAVDGLCLLRDT